MNFLDFPPFYVIILLDIHESLFPYFKRGFEMNDVAVSYP